MNNEPWIQTYTGKKFYFLNPTPDMIDVEDIAHALSMQVRFGGHINKFYSVAEHSVYVSELVGKSDKMGALFHDASEAYIADIVSPLKEHLRNYREIEDKLMWAISKKFGFEYPFHPDIHDADHAQLKTEAKALLNHFPTWLADYPTTRAGGVQPYGLAPEKAKALFLGTYMFLTTGDMKYA